MRTRRRTVAVTLLFAAMLSPAAHAQQEAPADKPVRLTREPTLYDVNADASEQIAAALAKAKQENRRVLIQWGGNWCGWCIQL
ncbi:MAG: hypothetical protein ACF8LK_08090, partial [Phycisphaerales bacterium JB041]